MDKDKYLKEIEKRLEFLTDEQKQTEIFRLNNEFDSDNYVNDISNEVNEIYKKYNINVEKEKSKRERKANLTGVAKYLDNFATSFKAKDKKGKFNIIKDMLLIFLVAILFKIPFEAVQTILFSVFQNSLPDIVYTIIEYLLNIIYAVLAIYYIYSRFKKRFKEEFGLEDKQQ